MKTNQNGNSKFIIGGFKLKKPPPPLIYINGFLGYNNFGDDIYEYIFKRYIKKCKIIQREINKKWHIWKLFFKITDEDILINCGGLFQDKTSIFSFLFYFTVNLFFFIKKAKVFNISIDSADIKFTFPLFKFIVKNSKFSQFRFPVCGVSSNIIFLPDLSLLFFKNYKPRILSPFIDKIIVVPYSIKEIKKLNFPEESIYFLMPFQKNIYKILKENNKPVIVYNGNIKKATDILFTAKNVITGRFHPALLRWYYGKCFKIILSTNKMEKFVSFFSQYPVNFNCEIYTKV